MSRIPLTVDSYEGNGETAGNVEIARFVVLYGKVSTRKHKIWEGDGILVCYSDSCVLKSEDEKDVICRSSALKNLDQLEDGRVVNIGSWSVEIQEKLVQKSQKVPVLPAKPENSKKRVNLGPLPVANLPAKRTTSFISPMMSENGLPVAKPEVIMLDDKTQVDQRFARQLRDHQKDGIRFIFRKLNGVDGGGAILADDMGLGKSIQTMAATWALVKGANVADSCLIVVPSSLVNNWSAEFSKWWRLSRFPAVLAQKASDVSGFRATCRTMPYLVISYELAMRCAEKLREIRFGVLVCDEGHRLKNPDSKLRKALVSLNIPRRLILTGTPMQNDFDEFHSLLDFVRPGQFGSAAEFRKMCAEDAEGLNRKVDECMLRRTAADVNTSHLPEKHEYILFCSASEIQKKIHTEICDFMTGDALSLIYFARQLANHPKLLYDNLREKQANNKHAALLVAFDGRTIPRGGVKESGKLTALVDMLKCFRLLDECAVVVSNYIDALDMIEQLCEYLEFRVFRLDGKTAVQDRQKAVKTFNEQRNASNVFLLSTKAGGVGLNLIGASRLVLFDSDWNPANDRQAMARIWRDGQVRPCHIYRLVTTGTIEEKMLQRQIKKTGLGCVIDAIEVGDSVSTFTDEELKDIFTFAVDTECNTHDLCNCICDGRGLFENEMEEDDDEIRDDSDDDEEMDDEELELEDEVVADSADEDEKKEEVPNNIASLAELSRWRHFSPRHQDTWSHFMKNAGLSGIETDVELTFAFYQESQY